MAKKGKGGRKSQKRPCRFCHRMLEGGLTQCPPGQCRPTVEQAAIVGRLTAMNGGNR